MYTSMANEVATSFFMLDSLHVLYKKKSGTAFAKSTANAIKKTNTAPYMLTVLGHMHTHIHRQTHHAHALQFPLPTYTNTRPGQ